MNNKKLLMTLSVLATPFAIDSVLETNQASANTTYVVNNEVKTYTNAANAAKGYAAKSTYKQGTYHVYKTANGMINISKVQGKPGAWINPNTNLAVVANTIQNKQQTAPAVTQTTKNTQTTTTTLPKKEVPTTGTYVLNTSVNAYTNAASAQNRVNAKTTYSQGNYYIFKSANGMLNISRVLGRAGAWINPTDNQVVKAKIESEVKKATNSQTTQTTKTNVAPTLPKTTVNTQKEGITYNSNGLLVTQKSDRAQQVINLLLGIPGHRNGAAYHAATGVDKKIDELTTAEALWVIHRIEGAGFGQTGDGYAGLDSALTHSKFVSNQLNRRFGGSVHTLLKKWGTYNYGGY